MSDETRRSFLTRCSGPLLAGLLPVGSGSGCSTLPPDAEEVRHWSEAAFRRPLESPVAVLPAGGYDDDLVALIRRGAALCGADFAGKRILLKPNLVEHDPSGTINTHPAVIGASVEALRSLGAADVVVGEASGHLRDTEFVLRQTGLLRELQRLRVPFLDLNLDDVVRTPVASYYMAVRHLYLPRALSSFDLLVSMPKVKTHHWAGVTLSMKNLFGVIPGRVYGWPKNFLHQHDIGRSILDINSTVPVAFCIADGIVGMEGNGPIQGEPRRLGVLVLGADPVAVDATCCRLMGIRPESIGYLRTAGRFLGNLDPAAIPQRGELLKGLASPFRLPPKFEHLRLAL